mmetsp:Transcript_25988/g.67357  ORF Transcript_25988/g.67357 Transcript_25988/m.67357 type:complete len:107 (-) Transcript_25988:55-375(-)
MAARNVSSSTIAGTCDDCFRASGLAYNEVAGRRGAAGLKPAAAARSNAAVAACAAVGRAISADDDAHARHGVADSCQANQKVVSLAPPQQRATARESYSVRDALIK